MKVDLEKIKEVYGKEVLHQIKNNLEVVTSNMYFLRSKGFTDIFDILVNNPYMFLYSSTIFQDKVNKLIAKLGIEYIEKLENDISLWGELDG